MSNPDDPARYTIAAVERAALICRLFSKTEPELTLAQIAERLQIPILSVAKIVSTLERRYFLKRGGDAMRYGLGPAWLAPAELKRRQFNLRDFVSPLLDAMRQELNETMTFGARDGDYRVVIDTVVSTQPVRRTTTVGFRTPIHVGSSGRAMLAQRTDAEIAAYLKRTKLRNIGHDTPTDAEFVSEEIKKIRMQGYATAEAEITRESFSASTPVFSYSGDVIGALTVTCPLSRATSELRAACIKVVRNNADTLSHLLGYRKDRKARRADSRRATQRKPSVPSKPTKPVRAVERALDILACYSEAHRHLSLQSLVDETHIHKATAFRFAATMVKHDLLSMMGARGPYALGFLPLRLADIILETNPLRTRALPWMERIHAELNETVVLAVRQNDIIVGLDHIEGGHSIIDSPEIGVPRPLHASIAGSAILATFDEHELQDYFSRHRLVGRLKQDVSHTLALVRRNADLNTQHSVVRVAPLLGDAGGLGALSVSVPVDRADRKLISHAQRMLQEAAAALSRHC